MSCQPLSLPKASPETLSDQAALIYNLGTRAGRSWKGEGGRPPSYPAELPNSGRPVGKLGV